jgi:hypothetical protein
LFLIPHSFCLLSFHISHSSSRYPSALFDQYPYKDLNRGYCIWNYWPCLSSGGLSLASHRGGPGSPQDRMWSLWWTKRHWGRFSPSTSVSVANHSTQFSINTITRGWHNRPISGRSAEWTQLTPPPTVPI